MTNINGSQEQSNNAITKWVMKYTTNVSVKKMVDCAMYQTLKSKKSNISL